jgi:hypothetical protein
MLKTVGRYAMAMLLWLVSAVLGGMAVIQAYEATRVVAALAIPVDPLQVVVSRKQVLLVSRLALVTLAFVWVILVIWLLVRAVKLLDTPRRLGRTFVPTLLITVIVIGLSTAIVLYLPALALPGGG